MDSGAQHHDGTPYGDEIQFHRPTIDGFIAQWKGIETGTGPNKGMRLDFSDYKSATTPGYHVLQMVLVLMMGHEDAVVRVVNIAISLACVAMVYVMMVRRVGLWGLALISPLLLSPYFNYAAIWLRPDNLGWVLVFAIMAICLSHQITWTKIAISSVLLVVLVFVRQSHIWCAAVIWMAAFIQAQGNVSDRIKRIGITILMTLPAFVLLGYFIKLWGGMVPPEFQSFTGAKPLGHSGWQHEGPNWGVPVIILAFIGGDVGVLWCIYTEKSMGNRHPPLGNIDNRWCYNTLYVQHSTHVLQLEYGRYSGLWNIAERLPTIEDRSPFMIGFGVLGGIAVVIWTLGLSPRLRWMMGIILAAFIASQTANAQAWQKYYEPLLLVWLSLRLAAY